MKAFTTLALALLACATGAAQTEFTERPLFPGTTPAVPGLAVPAAEMKVQTATNIEEGLWAIEAPLWTAERIFMERHSRSDRNLRPLSLIEREMQTPVRLAALEKKPDEAGEKKGEKKPEEKKPEEKAKPQQAEGEQGGAQ